MPIQGPNSPAVGYDSNLIGTVNWQTAGNVSVSDDVYSVANTATGSLTHYLGARDFGFSIPSGATVDGIVVEVERKKSVGISTATDNSALIRKSDGSYGTTNKALAGAWPTVDTYATYGSSSDLWGEVWTPADINNANFGFVIAANLNYDINIAVSVDHIRITVYYTISRSSATNRQSSSSRSAASGRINI